MSGLMVVFYAVFCWHGTSRADRVSRGLKVVLYHTSIGISMWTFFLLLACAGRKRNPEPVAPAPPVVPAPESSDYACAHTQARDPLVAQVTEGLAWDEALSGAVAGLGLSFVKPVPPGQYHALEPLTLPRLRWAAVVAGYPSPPLEIISGSVPSGEYPVGLDGRLESWVEPKNDLGVVRLRKGSEDLWLATRARSCVGFPNLKREYQLGEKLDIEGFKGNWRILTPEGEILSGVFPLELVLQAKGEYWLQINGAMDYELPIYVDMHIPPTNLFDIEPQPLDVPGVVRNSVLEALNNMRTVEDLPQLYLDGTLSTLSERPMQRYKESDWERDAELARLQGAGFVGGPVYQMGCDAVNVSECLDQMSWDLDNRAALLNPQFHVVGIHVEVSTLRVHVMISLASD